MIFSIVVLLTQGLKPELLANLSLLHAPFLLGLIVGGAVIYWFTGASTQAVVTGAYRAVEFIKANIKLTGSEQGLHRGQQEGGGDLHRLRPAGHVQHLPDGVLQHPGLRLPGAVLLHRLPDLHRPVRPVPGHLHGQRRRRLGQRQEAGRGRAEGKGHPAARRHRGGRHRGRPVQGHLVGGHEPGHQVHHPVRPAGGRAGHQPGPHAQRGAGRRLPGDLDVLRLALVLRHAHHRRTRDPRRPPPRPGAGADNAACRSGVRALASRRPAALRRGARSSPGRRRRSLRAFGAAGPASRPWHHAADAEQASTRRP